MMPREPRQQRRRKKDTGGELVLPKTFDKCPTCGSTRRFCEEALKGDLTPKDMEERPLVLYSAEFTIHPPGKLFPVHLVALMDVCVNCGTVYAFVLLKETLRPTLSSGGDGGRPGPLVPG